VRAWWTRWPDRLTFELDELKRAGIDYQILEQDEQSGILRLAFTYSVGGEPIALEVVFPCFYPFTRCEVIARDLDLQWHRNPFIGNLCLLGRSTSNWDTTMTVARLLEEQLPKLLEVARSEDQAAARDREEIQAEPLSAYLPYMANSIVLVLDDSPIPADLQSGKLNLRLSADQEFRAVVTRVEAHGTILSTTTEMPFLSGFPKNHSTHWYRSSLTPFGLGPEEYIKRLGEAIPVVRNPKWSDFRHGEYEIIGVRIPEEVKWRTIGESWVFILRVKHRVPGKKGAPIQTFFLRTGYASRTQFQMRIPELSPLASRRIGIVGLGCMGAPSTLELARAGVNEIRLMDFDSVEAGTTVRWPLGLSSVGRAKTNALAAFVESEYPFTRVERFTMGMGSAPNLCGGSLEQYERFVQGLDLIFDATAEEGINYLLSEIARERGIPYIGISTTVGGWGGKIWSISSETGCHFCLKKFTEEGKIPTPSSSPQGEVSIPGCAEPTFVAASFDTSMIPMAGVRMASSLLCNKIEGGYPASSWDVAVLKLRDQDGKLVLPEWRGFELPVHPACPNHNL
jgi:molybdopterin/thiamine biosynthesis adenylyltransferase